MLIEVFTIIIILSDISLLKFLNIVSIFHYGKL